MNPPIWLGEIPAKVATNPGFMVGTLEDAFTEGLSGWNENSRSGTMVDAWRRSKKVVPQP